MTQYVWQSFYNDLLHVCEAGDVQSSEKIAGFDIDGTIITTKSGRVFPIDNKDWRLLYENRTRDKLESLYSEGYKIVFITNQAGLATGKLKLEDFRVKVEDIIRKLNRGNSQNLNLPIQLFCCAASSGLFRKPRTAVWEFLARDKNGGKTIDLRNSFYCGDAAGRIKNKSTNKKDFSCSDRLFALNIGVPFWTPEQLFLGQKTIEDYKLPDFDPKDLQKHLQEIEKDENPQSRRRSHRNMEKTFLLKNNPKSATLTSITPEVIMMVGMQGSGKSTIAREWLSKAEPSYTILSNDALGGRDKTLAALRTNLKAGKSCVIDNTHVDVESRKKFLEIAKEFNIPTRAFVMMTSFEHSKHNNIFREIIDTSKEHAKIGEPLMHQYKNKYKEPSIDEGFNEILKINFVPKFSLEQHRQIYFMHLLEK